MQPQVTVSQRFWSKVDKSGKCWLWMAHCDRHGYGRFKPSSTVPETGAHRFAYEEANGLIPVGLQTDHLCRVRPCVRPAHIELVTSRENTLRGEGIAAKRARQTHCLRGHPFTAENTYLCSNGTRRCKVCQRETLRQWRARQLS